MPVRYIWIIFMFLVLAGCASTPEYNPLHADVNSELVLNDKALKEVKEGMTLDQVHAIMGQELIISRGLQLANNKPLTIPNPYKVEEIKGTEYMIEYYIRSMRRAGGIVRDDELVPLVFKDGKFIGRGWPLVNVMHFPTPVS
jgi:hypothetical protein